MIQYQAYMIRYWSLRMTTHAKSGHPTSCLSAADIMATLFFDAMKYDPYDPEYPTNDRFILSKGHASAALYAAWKQVGVLSEDELLGYRTFDSVLEGHPTARFKYFQAATGSLGMGLSIGLGMTLAGRLHDFDYHTYVLLGDSEMSEGSVWEAIELAAYYKASKLIGIIDANGLGQSTEPIYAHQPHRYVQQCASFGWHALEVNGHDVQSLREVIAQAREYTDAPTMIIAHTHKGYGIRSVEDKEGYHGKPFSQSELKIYLTELKERFADAAAYIPFPWTPPKPPIAKIEFPTQKIRHIPSTTYKKGEMIATRRAFGQSLALLGTECPAIVSLDAEVKNSTYAQDFQKLHAKRFYQCFIAEQNMVNMAIGFDRCKAIPFVSTFGAFFTRAYDQIRMAAIGNSALRLVGSHVGVSIGQDGPSQMALEDIAMIAAVPQSIILYPSDAVSTHKLLEKMVRYTDGISYMRTTRSETPVIYDDHEEFIIGGCKIVRENDNDCVCILAAGITLFEALKAHEQLAKQNIYIRVIDLYSIKPLDADALRIHARKSGSKIITVEDHYRYGGIGQLVAYALRNDGITIESLAVDHLPRSGTPEKLMAYEKIDTTAIIAAVEKILKR